MRAIIEPPPDRSEPLPSLRERLGWFAGIALAAAFTTAGVAWLLKALLG